MASSRTLHRRKTAERALKHDRVTAAYFQASVEKAESYLKDGKLDEAEANLKEAIQAIFHTMENVTKLRCCFLSLGKIYQKRAEINRSLEDLIKSVGLYNAALSRSTDADQKSHIHAQLEHLDRLALDIIGHSGRQCSGIPYTTDLSNQTHLREIRTKYEGVMDKIQILCDAMLGEEDQMPLVGPELKFVSAVKELYLAIATDMKEFLKRLLNQCLKQLGICPCSFALIALGSLARSEMTLYSDYEFAFLIENDTEINREYFRQLTYYLHVRILNLQETSLPALNIKSLNDTYSDNIEDDWFYDDGPRGVCFDANFPWASKIPLGRKASKYKNWSVELIASPQNLATFQEREINLKEGYHLADVLQKYTFVAGDPTLVRNYSDAIKEIQEKSKKQKNESSLNYIQKGAIDSLRKDMYKYYPLFDEEDGLHCLVKKDIYRLPSIFLEAASVLYNLQSSSSWETIKHMQSGDILTDKAAHNLSVVLSIATWLRLKTYMFNKSQKEYISFIPQIEEDENNSKEIKHVYHVDNKALFVRYMATVFPLAIAINLSCGAKLILPFVPDNKDLYGLSPLVKGIVHIYLLDYHEAAKYLQQVITEQEADRAIDKYGIWKYITSLNCLAHVQNHLGLVNESLLLRQRILFEYERISDGNTSDDVVCIVISTVYYIGVTYRIMGNYKMALSFSKQSVDQIDRMGHEYKLRDVAQIYANHAMVLAEMGDPKAGAALLEELIASPKYHSDINRSTIDVVQVLLGLGICYIQLGEVEKAQKVLGKCHNMITRLFGSSHPILAEITNNLAITHTDTETAARLFEKAYALGTHCFGPNSEHHIVVDFLMNLATCYNKLGLDVLDILKHALSLYRKIYGATSTHPNIAKTLYNMGEAYRMEKKIDLALLHHGMSLEMRQNVFGEERNHTEVAISFLYLGMTYFEKGQYDVALENYQKALDMYHKVYGTKSGHRDIIITHEKLMVVFACLRNNAKMIQHLVDGEMEKDAAALRAEKAEQFEETLSKLNMK